MFTSSRAYQVGIFGKSLAKRSTLLFPLSRHLSLDGTLLDTTIGLTSTEKAIQASALAFAHTQFRPHMRHWDETRTFPRHVLRACAKQGFTGMYTSAEKDGSGCNRLEGSLIYEALAQGCVSTTAFLSIHNATISMLAKFGSTQLQERFLADLISFEKMASYCLTEPGAGSDATSLTTTATAKDGYYVLNGTKAFISGAGESDVYFVLCRTGGPGAGGISCILVEKGTPGLTFGKLESKLGWSSQPTRAVYLADCKVPEDNLLGATGAGFKYAMYGLNSARVNIASISNGAAQWALEVALQYTAERKQFNSRLLDFQTTQFKVASYAAELLSSRLLVRAAARRIDQEEGESQSAEDVTSIPMPSLCAAGKLLATEKAFTIIDGCLQLLGGAGYLADFPLAQLLRDTRVHRILEGTNDIMQLIIARDLLKNYQK